MKEKVTGKTKKAGTEGEWKAKGQKCKGYGKGQE